MASLQHSDPRHVGAYRLIERLAVGGMGIVYLGESQSGRKVAVKLIRLEQAGEPEFRARFRSEIAACRLVSGFHTAAFIDADPDADRPWMVTQYVPGPSLDAKVSRDGALAPAAVHQLAAALAEGLDAIHSAGLVHRDLKPGNIIMADDGPRIIDFGIAKRTGDSGDLRLTATGMVVGTPAFLSPEQLGNDGAVGPASDIFSLGSVLAFAATGRAPFDVGDLSATIYAVVNRPPNLRLAAGPLLDIVTACLAKDPARRPTAAALLTYLYRTRSSLFPDPGVSGNDSDGLTVVPVAAAAPDQSRPLPRNPALAGSEAAARTPAEPAPVRAYVRRGALTRRSPAAHVPGPPVPVSAAAGTAADLPQAMPSPVQVRPARHGWRLVACGATGRWLASANGDGIITSWLAAPGQPVRSWPAGAGVRAMTAGPDDLLVVATDDGRVRAWDVATGIGRRYLPDSVASLTGPGVRVRALGLDPSGSWLGASIDGRLLLWDVTDPAEPLLAAKLPTRAEVTALAFDDTGWRLATGGADGKVHVWDLAELADARPVPATPGASAFDAVPLETTWIHPPGTLPDASRPRSGRVLALAWDDTSDRWLSVGAHGRPDSAAGQPAATDSIGIDGVPLRAAALSSSGGFAAMIDDARGRVYLTNLDGPADGGAAGPRVLDGTGLSVTGVAFAGSGTLAIGGSDGSLRLWDPARRATRLVKAAGSPVTAVAASPGGDRLVVSDRRAKLHSFTAVNGSFEPGWAVDSPPAGECLAFRADGTRLVTAGDVVRIWEAADGSPAGILPGRTGRGRAVAADHDGNRIAVAWAEAVVSVWQGSKLLWELTGHHGAVLTVAFGPRPGLLLSAGDDHTIRTWDLATGKEVACHTALGYRVTVLAASRSGGAIAGGCADGTIRLCEGGEPDTLPDWTGAPVLAGHVHGITAMSFDRGGRFLATASRDGTARIWDLATRSATTVLLPGAAAVVSADGTWRGLGETDGLIWQAVGLSRVPLPTLEAGT
ncbi:MAG: protein kinase [Trebonia sp.]